MKAIARLLWPGIDHRCSEIIATKIASMNAEIETEVISLIKAMDYGPIQEELLEYILSHIVLGVEFSLREDESPKRWYNLN